MQLEQYAIERTRSSDALNNLAGNSLVGIFRHVGAWRCDAPQNRNNLRPCSLEHADSARAWQLLAAHGSKHLPSSHKRREGLGNAKSLVVSYSRRKGVGLVLKADDSDPHGCLRNTEETELTPSAASADQHILHRSAAVSHDICLVAMPIKPGVRLELFDRRRDFDAPDRTPSARRRWLPPRQHLSWMCIMKIPFGELSPTPGPLGIPVAGRRSRRWRFRSETRPPEGLLAVPLPVACR